MIKSLNYQSDNRKHVVYCVQKVFFSKDLIRPQKFVYQIGYVGFIGLMFCQTVWANIPIKIKHLFIYFLSNQVYFETCFPECPSCPGCQSWQLFRGGSCVELSVTYGCLVWGSHCLHWCPLSWGHVGDRRAQGTLGDTRVASGGL